jgi:glycosyltransferase involved in cell wall biosynthesis
MHIAVVVPAFNIAPFVRECMLSVVAQTHTNWTLIVIDDGSTDATAAVAAGVRDDRIRVLRQDNAGVSAARNTGIAAALAMPGAPCRSSENCVPEYRLAKHSASGGLARPHLPLGVAAGDKPLAPPLPALNPARGTAGADAKAALPGNEAKRRPVTADALLFLDGDDWLAPNALAALADGLENAPWAVAACGRYARVARLGAASLSPPPSSGLLLERLLTRNLFANGGHLLIRRHAIEAVGDFRRDLCYGEDWEYWTRLALLGEFAALRTRSPVLFVRERPGSAYRSHATDPTAYQPALEAIYRNPAIAEHLGRAWLADLGHRAEAETAWTVGRELVRHGRQRDGRHWLARSFRDAPNLKRLLLIGLSWPRCGPFRPYRTVA